MRRAVFVLSLAFFVFVGGRRGQQQTEQARLGQITLSVRSVLTFSAQRKGTYVEPTVGRIREENETADSITYTYTMTQRLNVTEIEDRMLIFGPMPETETMDSSLAIEGGGQESGVRTADGDLVFRIKGTWTYKAPPLPEDSNEYYVDEIILGGPFKVIHPHPLPQSPEVACTGTVVSRVYGSGPYKTLGLASSLAPRVMNRALKDPGFLKQFEGTTPDNESGFQVSGKAQFSASGTEEDRNRPGITINWAGRWEVQYTLGYAPETNQECEPLKTACERARSWFDCARQHVGSLLRSIAQTKAETALEKTARQAQYSAGVADPEAPGYLQLDIAVDRLMQQVTAWETNLVTSQAMVRADCALLPGPQAEEACQGAASRVEEATRKSREELTRNLEREVMIFEGSTTGAPSSLARTKVLTQVRATLALLQTCQ